MPMKPLKPCRHPGCPNLTDERYCLQHSPLYQRASAHKRGYTSKWQRRSKQFLKKHPLCVSCKQNGKLSLTGAIRTCLKMCNFGIFRIVVLDRHQYLASFAPKSTQNHIIFRSAILSELIFVRTRKKRS